MFLIKYYFTIFHILCVSQWMQAAQLRYYRSINKNVFDKIYSDMRLSDDTLIIKSKWFGAERMEFTYTAATDIMKNSKCFLLNHNFHPSSLEDYRETDLHNPGPLLNWIDFSKPTLFYAFGFNGYPNKADVSVVTNAFIEKNHTNYILVNWELEARNDLLEPILAHALTAAPNSILIGKELGISLLQLSCKLDMSTVQLAGHSLGAHLVGYAGTLARERGVIISRITGLDPSSVKYEAYIYSKGLDSSSAAFVAVWHTNPGDLGTTQALGDVDVWFNCKALVQPGCSQDGYLYRLTDIHATCSHSRSVFYFAEAVSSPESFVAVRASSCVSWANGYVSKPKLSNNNIVFINEKINTSARGSYYLSTNTDHPYGRGLEGIKPN